MAEPGHRRPAVDLRHAVLPAHGEALLVGEARSLVVPERVVDPAEGLERLCLSGGVAELAPETQCLLDIGQRLVLRDAVDIGEAPEQAGSGSVAGSVPR